MQRLYGNHRHELLHTSDFGAKGLIKKFKVKRICTTDDPVSDLVWHKKLADEAEENGFKVLPTFRPDDLLDINLSTFTSYCAALSQVSGI